MEDEINRTLDKRDKLLGELYIKIINKRKRGRSKKIKTPVEMLSDKGREVLGKLRLTPLGWVTAKELGVSIASLRSLVKRGLAISEGDNESQPTPKPRITVKFKYKQKERLKKDAAMGECQEHKALRKGG